MRLGGEMICDKENYQHIIILANELIVQNEGG